MTFRAINNLTDIMDSKILHSKEITQRRLLEMNFPDKTTINFNNQIKKHVPQPNRKIILPATIECSINLWSSISSISWSNLFIHIHFSIIALSILIKCCYQYSIFGRHRMIVNCFLFYGDQRQQEIQCKLFNVWNGYLKMRLLYPPIITNNQNHYIIAGNNKNRKSPIEWQHLIKSLKFSFRYFIDYKALAFNLIQSVTNSNTRTFHALQKKHL